jgi:hypothetical protein
VGHGRRVCGLRVVEEGCVSCRTTHVMPANIVSAVSPSASSSGSWDSIHVFDAQDRARTAHYKLTSTVILSLGTDSEALGALNLSGNMVRQVEADMAVEDDTSHVANVGKMVEDMELKMRNLLQEVYFGKAKDVVGDLRSRCLCCACGIFADEVRYCVAQPDESRSCDAEGDDQQYGSVGSKPRRESLNISSAARRVRHGWKRIYPISNLRHVLDFTRPSPSSSCPPFQVFPSRDSRTFTPVKSLLVNSFLPSPSPHLHALYNLTPTCLLLPSYTTTA